MTDDPRARDGEVMCAGVCAQGRGTELRAEDLTAHADGGPVCWRCGGRELADMRPIPVEPESGSSFARTGEIERLAKSEFVIRKHAERLENCWCMEGRKC